MKNSCGSAPKELLFAVAVIAMLCAAPLTNAQRTRVGGSAISSRATLAAFAAAPQAEEGKTESAAGEHAGGEGEHESPLTEVFHWVNFLLVAGGIAYLIKKLLVPFLNERSRLIRAEMEQSSKAIQEADQRMAAVEAKLKNMDAEMAALRQNAFRESEAEKERIAQAAADDAAKILAMAEQEIEAGVKAARQELKSYTAELAVGLAEKKIRESLTPASEQRILHGFVSELSSGDDALARKG
jgi:F-type H+-transporting ATPase subunit b